MRVRTRLLLTLAAVLLLGSLPGWYAVHRVQSVRDIAFDLKTNQAAASVAVGRYQVALTELEHAQRAWVAALSPGAPARIEEALHLAEAQLDVLGDAGYAEAATPARESLAELRAVAMRLDALIEHEELDAATDFLSEIRPLYGEAVSLLQRLTADIDQRSADALADAERIADSTGRWGVIALLLGALAGAAIGLYTSADLAGALRRLRAAHARLGEGNGEPAGSEDLPDERTDEIGDLARSFRAMAAQLSELDRMKAEFVSMASHEIKAPAGMIGSYAELLAEELEHLEGEPLELLDAIRGQSASLSRQVQQLLELARLEAGGFKLRVEEVDARDFLEAVVQAYRPLARATELELQVQVDPSVAQRARIDPEALRVDVLGNLLGNAFKFSSPGGSVRLHARGEGDALLISVSDTGAGIPPEQLPYVFEKYWQAGRHAGKVGSGLGLAIARMVVEAHGGRIEVASRLGQGTTFHIVLPGVGVDAGGWRDEREAVPA